MKILILLSFILSSIVCLSQNEKESSIIHIIRSNAFAGSAVEAEIVFHNQRSFIVPVGAQVDYQIFSTGSIVVTANYGGLLTKQVELNIESNQEYYLLFDKGKFSEQSKEEIQKYADKVVNKLNYKENIDFPINKESISQNKKGPSQGSGFLLNNQGYIITNFHVIEDAKTIKVEGIKGDFTVPFTARVIAVDRLTDLALLKIDSKLVTFETPPYEFIHTKNTSKAERVFALGYPLQNTMGGEVKVTDGIINSLTGFKQSISEFQISAPVQPGNSGGPLFNSQGQLIGIISAKIKSEYAEQVGYAIKSDYILFFLENVEGIELNTSENILSEKTLSDQVKSISNFVYIIKCE